MEIKDYRNNVLAKLDYDDEMKEFLKDRIIDGRACADQLRMKAKENAEALASKGILPRLVIIQVGSRQDSDRYVSSKIKAANEIGIHASHLALEYNTSEEKLLDIISMLNTTDTVSGIIVQKPLPDHISESNIDMTISHLKDVDGFHPMNSGILHSGGDVTGRVPCTAQGVIDLIKSTGEKLEGKKAVVIGRSNIVGRPVAKLLELENMTVTVCHSKTPESEMIEEMRRADVIVSAVGKAGFITRGMYGFNQIIIDVGINEDGDGKLCGDVVFKDAIAFAKHITPVPGGVGPMTVANLMKNTIICAAAQNKMLEVLKW